MNLCLSRMSFIIIHQTACHTTVANCIVVPTSAKSSKKEILCIQELKHKQFFLPVPLIQLGIYKRATSSRQRHKTRENLMPFHGGVNLSLGVNVYLNSALVNRSRRPLIMALSQRNEDRRRIRVDSSEHSHLPRSQIGKRSF